MRTAGYTVSPIRDIQCSVAVRVSREPAAQTSEHRLVPERLSHFATSRTGERCIGGANERHRNASQSSQQQNALCKELRTPLPPLRQRSGILKRDASARPASTAHQLPGFFGLRLSRSSQRVNLSIMQVPLLIRCSLLLFVQNRPEVWPLIPIRTSDSATHAHVNANPFSRRNLSGGGNFYPNPAIPLPILPEDLTLLTERSAGQRQGAIDRPVLSGGDVELAHPLHHHPQIKARRLSGCLYLGGIDQLSFEKRRLEFSVPVFRSRTARSLSQHLLLFGRTLLGAAQGGQLFGVGLLSRSFDRGAVGRQAAAVVGKRTSGCPSNELALSLTGGESGFLRSRNGSCGVRVRPAKEARQENQHVRLGSSRKQFKFIPENYFRRHGKTLAKQGEKSNPTPCAVSFASVNGRHNGPLRLRLWGLRKPTPSGYAGFVELRKPKTKE